ncbi:MAG: Gfo/Idh/MocA family oxidoreductase [Ignavibacteriaceae bacterium]|nr:Gfo/Idh/MocA family oxidoreductase [Ignavibacteriaceae bacterium]
MEKTKIAVIGLGGIAQLVHLPNIAQLSNAVVTAVAELNKSRLNTIAEKFSVEERYSDYNELISNSDAEAIIIATPTHTHKEIALAAIKAGKDILVEKPLARSYEEAKEIVDASKKFGRKLMVGMNLRFRPDAMILRSILNSGEIGEPYYIKAGWIRRQSSAGTWVTKKEESGGGVIIDLGIHLVDLSLWLLNYPPVYSVSTQNFFTNTKTVEDSSISFMKLKTDSLLSIESSWSLPVERDTFYVNIYGTKGFASLNPSRVYKKIDEQIIDLIPLQRENAITLFKKSYVNELKSFIGAVKNLNPVFSSGDEALERMKILEAMYESANKKDEIKL